MKDTIAESFADIEDPRVLGRVLHPAVNIIYISIAAVLCGFRGWEDIEDFGEALLPFLSERLDMSNGVPSHDTINRFFQIIDPDNFQQCLPRWVAAVEGEGDLKGQTVSIDGKTIRLTSRMSADGLPVHVVSAWASDKGLVIGQVGLEWQEGKDKQENEILAIPKLLDKLDIEGDVVTIDAIGTQTAIAEKIVGKKADYILSVKGNQPTLLADVERYFANHPGLEGEETIDFGHGRIEVRKYYVSDDLSYLADPDRWAGLSSIVRVQSSRTDKKTGEESVEDRYYISSLTESKRISSSIREHWGVESMHWTMDVNFGEDLNAKRARNAAFNFDTLCKLALNILKNDGYDHGKKKISIRRKMNKAVLNREYLAHLLSLL